MYTSPVGVRTSTPTSGFAAEVAVVLPGRTGDGRGVVADAEADSVASPGPSSRFGWNISRLAASNSGRAGLVTGDGLDCPEAKRSCCSMRWRSSDIGPGRGIGLMWL